MRAADDCPSLAFGPCACGGLSCAFGGLSAFDRLARRTGGDGLRRAPCHGASVFRALRRRPMETALEAHVTGALGGSATGSRAARAPTRRRSDHDCDRRRGLRRLRRRRRLRGRRRRPSRRRRRRSGSVDSSGVGSAVGVGSPTVSARSRASGSARRVVVGVGPLASRRSGSASVVGVVRGWAAGAARTAAVARPAVGASVAAESTMAIAGVGPAAIGVGAGRPATPKPSATPASTRLTTPSATNESEALCGGHSGPEPPRSGQPNEPPPAVDGSTGAPIPDWREVSRGRPSRSAGSGPGPPPVRLSNRPIRSARNRAWKSAAAATRRSAMAAAGRDTIRSGERQMCAERLLIEGPAGGDQRPIHPRARGPRAILAPSRSPATARAGVRTAGRPQPRRSRCRTGRSRGGRGEDGSRAASTRSSRVGPMNRSVRWSPSSLTQRTSRPPPGTPSLRTRSTSAAIDRGGLGRERDRHEQAASGQIGSRPARPRRRWTVTQTGRIRSAASLVPGRPGRRAAPRALGRDRASRGPRRSCPRAPCTSRRTARSRPAGAGRTCSRPLDVLLMGVADRHAQHLEVEALLVVHLEPADRAGPDVAAGEGRLVDDQQGVGVVAIAGAGALDEAVVEVVVDGARQHAVEPEDAASPRRTRTCCGLPRGISTTISMTSGTDRALPPGQSTAASDDAGVASAIRRQR